MVVVDVNQQEQLNQAVVECKKKRKIINFNKMAGMVVSKRDIPSYELHIGNIKK